MLPTKDGYYWYQNEPVKVWKSHLGYLCFDQFVPGGMGLVKNTDAENWGPEIPEIVPPDREGALK